jgi:hypothetical protein
MPAPRLTHIGANGRHTPAVKCVQGSSTAVGVTEVFEVGTLLNFAKAIDVNLRRYPHQMQCARQIIRKQRTDPVSTPEHPSAASCKSGLSSARCPQWFRGRTVADCGRDSDWLVPAAPAWFHDAAHAVHRRRTRPDRSRVCSTSQQRGAVSTA